MKRLTIETEDGSLVYTTDSGVIDKILSHVQEGIHWHKTAKISTIRSAYFSMLKELSRNTNTGYSKTDLHNAIRPIILTAFKEMPHYFVDDKWVDTTKGLNYEGWLATIEQLKIVANDIFSYTFKQ